jgi:release factor glutamine methyltransferase
MKTVSSLTIHADAEEKTAIAFALIENLTGLNRTEILTKTKAIDFDHIKWEISIDRINKNEPVQYVTGEAFFYGFRFLINQHVLIPRPETELLIDNVLAYAINKNKITIADACTGSGCIGITLQKKIPKAKVYLTDVSENALAIATANAKLHAVAPNIIQSDLLYEDLPFHSCDVLVSNPPYVRWQEKETMQPNVVNFEPHLALFVPDDDALIFYKSLAEKGKKVLNNGGLLAVEINEALSDDVVALFRSFYFQNIKVHHDYNHKKRIVTAIR